MTKYLSDGDSNTKTAKNRRDTLILYLAPLNQNSYGVNMCPKASVGCAASCLFTAGRGAMSTVANARRQKTDALLPQQLEISDEIIIQICEKAEGYARLYVEDCVENYDYEGCVDYDTHEYDGQLRVTANVNIESSDFRSSGSFDEDGFMLELNELLNPKKES